MAITRGKFLGAVLLFLLPILLWVGIANGQSFRSGDTTTVPASETVNSSLFASGRTIDIAGTVDGDVYCAGLNISITGTVNGDVICAGQNITVSGTVDGDVRLAGQSVTVGGKVDGNASVASSSFVLDSQALIGRDLNAAGTDLVLNGSVGRDAALASQTATINSRIGRNVNASVDDLRLRGQSNVRGGLYYTSPKTVDIAEGARVAGETKRTVPTQQKSNFEAPFVTGFGFVMYLIVSLLILSLALVLPFPAALQSVTSLAVASPLKVALVGFVAAWAVPILAVMLMITVLGIPLALLLLGAWLLILFLSGPVFGYYVGRMLLRGLYSPIIVMALGSLVVLILLFVPVLGLIVWFVSMWMGAGMIILELTRRTPRPRYEPAATNK